MFGSLRRLLVVGAVGVTAFVMMVLTAMPAAASAPRNNPCPSGNFTCYRANHIHVTQPYRVVRVVTPAYVAPRYVVPQYVAPQYVTSYTPSYMPGYNTVGSLRHRTTRRPMAIIAGDTEAGDCLTRAVRRPDDARVIHPPSG